MTRDAFRALTEENVVLLDGATGTNLQRAGMPAGVCPELWVLEHPDVLLDLQRAYLEAGTKILYAPTFSGNRLKLAEYGLAQRERELNQSLVALSKEAVRQSGREAFVVGDLTMTGQQLYPVGTLPFEELVTIYKEQITALAEAGADLLVVETMMSLNECRAALLAAREVCDLPVMVSLTFKEDGRTFYGTDPAAAVTVLQAMGADAVGANCSTGPMQMVPVISSMKAHATIPLLAKPNAGLPVLRDGETVYDMDPDTFGTACEQLLDAGVALIGGCCGTTPDHIRILSEKSKGRIPAPPLPARKSVLCSERTVVELSLGGPFVVVGERINPTGKKDLQASLRAGELDLVCQMAQEQQELGAKVLDVNLGTSGIDEKEMMEKAVYALMNLVNTPLSIDSSHVDVIEAALRIYPGRALINSISLEKEKIDRLLPIAKKYGAMFILLPLSEKGLPGSLDEKKEIIHTIYTRALELGLQAGDIVADGLVNTVGANPSAARDALATIHYCREELGLATICGLSNISFGLPDRAFINSSFLSMAIENGLTMAIANPSQELLMRTVFASDLLLGKPGADLAYIERTGTIPFAAGKAPDGGSAKKAGKETGKAATENTAGEKAGRDSSDAALIFDLVVKGNKKQILPALQQVLSAGHTPKEVLDDMLIPAIQKVGDLFDQQIYFLPQLIAGAQTMQMAVDYLEPLLRETGSKEELGTVIICSVQGDIHDIGKNLVALMLKNVGFRVVDLGKDVPAETIIEAAKRENADIIGLSALMTTTMMQMKKVIQEAKAAGLKAKIMIGGAVITQSFADEIGADGYSKDAADAVRVAKKLMGIS